MTRDRSCAGAGVREHWHVDDQFQRQLETPGAADVIQGRWRVFEQALRSWGGAADDTPVVHVLDAGCGDGINLVGLRRMLPELGRPWRLWALDTNPVRIARARVTERADNRILQASVTALPFASASLDVVLCSHVIEHVPGPATALEEIARVLKPGGLAIIGVPNEGCGLARLRNHVLQRSILRTTDHVNFFTAGTLAGLLAGSGFTVRAVHTEGFFFPHMRLTGLARATRLGHVATELAARVLPGQAAGLIAVAVRLADPPGPHAS